MVLLRSAFIASPRKKGKRLFADTFRFLPWRETMSQKRRSNRQHFSKISHRRCVFCSSMPAQRVDPVDERLIGLAVFLRNVAARNHAP